MKSETPFSIWLDHFPSDDEIMRMSLSPWRYRLWKARRLLVWL